MIFNHKTVEGDTEGQRHFLHIVAIQHQITVDGMSLTQLHHTLLRCEMGEQCTDKYDYKREMKHDNEKTTHTATKEIGNGKGSEQRP